ncbi:hypothetical protein K505DRAFT_207343, partial [Melanomma pulvis-pyrius CBS 109.77]
MAPTGATSTLPATPTASPPLLQPQGTSGFEGDEFSNNLFSDLAPLLTLFGEQVTKQFLSMSMGWADNILLGMGPLGIITTVVSAIRVGGVRKLKALIGRARESPATAEQEILSSTSNNVCELWNGNEIVRQLGKCKTTEFVMFTSQDGEIQLADLPHSVHNGWLKLEGSESFYSSDKAEALSLQSPNIALNMDRAIASDRELGVWTALGVILQFMALIIPAVVTYHWKWQKGTTSIQAYAYPCFLAGSCLVTIGIILCSYVIEATTTETTFVPCDDEQNKKPLKIFRLQIGCTVGDQQFPSCVILNPKDNRIIRTSRLLPGSNKKTLTWAGLSSFLTIVGFICQFVGLRSLHWSATIIQLGVTLFMTGVRSWVRRGLAHDIKSINLNLDVTNLDRLALEIGERCL